MKSLASLRCAWDARRAACPGAAPGPFHVLHSRSGVSCFLRASPSSLVACLPMSMPTRSHGRFIQQAQPVQRAHLRPSAPVSSVCGSETRDERPETSWAAPERGRRALGHARLLDDTTMGGATTRNWSRCTSDAGVHLKNKLGIKLLELCQKLRP